MQQEFEQKPPRDILKMPRNNSFYFRAKFGVTYSAFKYLLKNSMIGNRLVRSGGLKKVMASILPSDSCKCWGKKTARNSGIFHYRLQLVYNLQWPILYQNLIRSRLGTISFIQEFNFDVKYFKNAETVRLVPVGTLVSFPRDFPHQKFTQLLSFYAICHRREM